MSNHPTPGPQHAETPHLTTLLLFALPPSSFLGLDLFSFTTSPTPHKHPFHGLKLVPSGLHHLYIAPGPLSDFSPRTGLWFYASGAPGSVIALRWSDQEGQLVQATEQDLWEKGDWVKWWYDGSLVEYRATGESGMQEAGEARIWKALVGEVGEGTLARVTEPPTESGDMCSSLAGEIPQKLKLWRVESASSGAQDRDDEILSKIQLPQGIENTRMNINKSKDDQTLNILPIDLKRTFPPTATGRERTLAAQDRSWYLNHLISTYLVPHTHPPPPTCIVQLDPGSREVLGELEFAFIHALTLANYSCSQAYMRILTICLTCEERILTKPGFYHRLIEVLITEVGVGLDCFAPPDAAMGDGELGGAEGHGEAEAWAPDWLTEGPNPLPKLLRRFLRTLKRLLGEVELAQHRETLEELLTRLCRLEAVVESKFGWVIDTSKVVKKGFVQLEDGEMVELEMTALLEEEEEEEGEGPVVVEL